MLVLNHPWIAGLRLEILEFGREFFQHLGVGRIVGDILELLGILFLVV
jgi:hypothetical protein